MIFAPDFIKTNNEILNEERVYTALDSEKVKFMLYVVPERGRTPSGLISYFKFKPGSTFSTSTGVARISFRGPGYIIHEYSPDGPLYELEKDEYRILNKILLKRNKKHPEDTNWVRLIKEFNRAQGTDRYENIYFYNANNIPSELPFVPLDQPIPDYTLLKHKQYYNRK